MNFEFLNSFRGICASIVVVSHSCWNQDKENLNKFLTEIIKSANLAVMGFFILSSFLLTYRFMTDLNRYSFKLTLSLYFIRRFFRIYIVFVVYCTLLKNGPKFFGGIYNDAKYSYFASWTDLISLRKMGINHLWSIPPEIFYYFILPIIPFLFMLIKKKHVPLVLFVLFSHLNMFFNIFNLPTNINDKIPDLSDLFRMNLPIFIYGSALACVLKLIEENKFKLINFIKSRKYYMLFVNISTLILIVLTWHANDYININKRKINVLNPNVLPGYLLALAIFIMLISERNTNIFNYLLENNFLFKYVGKFSFGIYLWHPMCISIQNHHGNVINEHFNKYLDIFITSFLVGCLFFYLIENNLIYFANYLCTKIKGSIVDKKKSINQDI